jgi:hypothetical protein
MKPDAFRGKPDFARSRFPWRAVEAAAAARKGLPWLCCGSRLATHAPLHENSASE